MSYAAVLVRGLVACPFCREMFPRGEHRECPICGVALVAAAKLPEKLEGYDEEPGDDAPNVEKKAAIEPYDERLPWTYWRRGRGLLAVIAALGLVAFALPWVDLYAPDRLALSGIDIARRTGLTWACGVAWFTLLPAVLSRRTIRAMRGARLAAFVLAAIPLICAGSILTHPPASAHVHGMTMTLRYAWAPGVWITVALGAIAAAASWFFGGRTDLVETRAGSSSGHTLH